MKKEEFRELLLDSAFFVMACDGEIHDDELKVIRELSKKTAYFEGLDLDARIAALNEELESNSRSACQSYFARLREGGLDSAQQLLVVEVVLRLTYADLRLDDNEVLFLKTAVKAIGVQHEELRQRFGSIEGFIADKPEYKSSSAVIEPGPEIKDKGRASPSFEPPEFAALDKAMAVLRKRLDEKKGE